MAVAEENPPVSPEAVKKSAHGSTGSPRAVWHRRKSNYLAVRPEPGRRADGDFFTASPFSKGDYALQVHCPSLTKEGVGEISDEKENG